MATNNNADVDAKDINKTTAPDETVSVDSADKHHPLSLEDAVAAAELAASEIADIDPIHEKKNKKTMPDDSSKFEEELGNAASYNPNMIIEDLEDDGYHCEIPEIAKDADDTSEEFSVVSAADATKMLNEDNNVDATDTESLTESAPSVENSFANIPAANEIVNISEPAEKENTAKNDKPAASENTAENIKPIEKSGEIITGNSAEETKSTEKIIATDNNAIVRAPAVNDTAFKKTSGSNDAAHNKKDAETKPIESKSTQNKSFDKTTVNKDKNVNKAKKTTADTTHANTTVKSVSAEKTQPVKTAKSPDKKNSAKHQKAAAASVADLVESKTVKTVETPNETVANSKSADKSVKGKSKKKQKNSKNKKDTETTVADNTAAPAEENTDKEKQTKKEKKLKAKLDPATNFKLLKILIIILTILVTAVSGYIYYRYIYTAVTAFTWEKFVPTVPFITQVLLALIALITVGTSKRKPIGATIKENKQEAREIREKKEFEDTLLDAEVKIPTKPLPELNCYQIDSFYKKNIEEINGKYYMQVAKFDESVRAYDSMGATDMELCAVNMVGSAKFDEILDQPRTKTLNCQDLIRYFLSKPNTFVIKKRGNIDWTFKYETKSFGIVRENDDSYKVSIKCYPDAATRVNDVYKALEDSNFPSGPLWYCFNELRNLPPRVCKWLIDTSCQISRFQQIKTNKLKENVKTAADFDIDMADIAEKFKAGQKVIEFPKFVMIFSKGEEADLITYLVTECEGVDASAFTKEYYFKFADNENAVSILCPSKGVNEEIVIAILNEIEKITK